jgi:predicted nucleotide-binding protein
MEPSKTEILERLRISVAQAEVLKNNPDCTSFPGFEKWRRATEKLLSEAFDNSADHLKMFKDLIFSPIEIYGLLTVNDKVRMEHFNGGLNRAIDLLSGFMEEVQTYWIDDDQRREIHTGKQLTDGSENRKVFVVHGHDDIAREQLELVLNQLELDPYVLANTSGGGLTIIEALEKEISQHPDAARFGVVLLTPDDIGYSARSGSKAAQPRARQNVIFEMGMIIDKLGRPNVAILKKGEVEMPSDMRGIIDLSFQSHVREVVPRLVERLKMAGFDINQSRIPSASE